MPTKPTDKLLVYLQQLIPARLLGRLIYRLARSEKAWLKNSLIRGFVRLYRVETTEAERPVPNGYRSFNDFFTRALKPGARIIDGNDNSLACPADGTIAQLGRAAEGRLMQAKGMHFTAADLLGDAELATELKNALFTTIYLAPYNYHRLHMPLTGTLEKSIFIPGLLYSVNARTAAAVPDLYALNERLVCQFSGPSGRFAMVLVGAMNVASISTAWGGEIHPPADRQPMVASFDSTTAPSLLKGDYMGHFNMGSTVILLGPAGVRAWRPDLCSGMAVRVGQSLAQVEPA